MTAIAELRAEFDQLNRDYLAVHKTKEDLFWDTYMAVSDDHDGFARAEADYKAFISSQPGAAGGGARGLGSFAGAAGRRGARRLAARLSGLAGAV
ncbi:hypothetical protein JOS77_11705 [Chromobacterium haemolyticum]|nr:hypothetical protein JOS77_11705 [Chromobacterium haemolyticum]